MSKLKQAFAATAAAAGLTLGAFAMAAPASAVAVNYDCGTYGVISADYSNNGTSFEFIAYVGGITGDTAEISLDGSSATWGSNSPDAMNGGVSGGFAVLNGTSASASTGAPDSINIHIPGPPVVNVPCTKI